MAGGQPGSNSRGRGGKFRKFTRGGGKHFSRDLRPLDADGNEINMWSADSKKKDDESSEEDSEEDSEEESDSEDDGKPQAEMSRTERKAAAKARKDAAIAKKRAQAVEVGDLPPSDSEEESSEDEADMPANPNHSKAARNQTKAPVAAPEVDEAAEGVKKLAVANNRKERESMEAAQAKERYRKLHEAGKTDEAKADLARLRLIREQRAADAARRDAEREEREAQEAAKRKEIEAKEAKKREAALGPVKKGKKSSK
ncbi:casein kinase substrate phosphoprotein pp28 [Colletotrichum tofieldiae]|nr:casein kinase substrate phosphoprotein pp28 [Colletotrichum tofieldiae]GKT81748.1 casein kinase substrate phosphoprotein pp28 [Colletotrichum tofieldiae]GKT82774.1 casein kinase substrate phosphoprotein pp28 [Colletotrichum tofieldiae]